MSELFANLGINGKLLFAQVANFLLIFFVLAKFVFPRLLGFIEKRRERIEEGLELTEKAEREMTRIGEARHAQLESARRDAEEILARAKTSAEQREKEILQEARRSAESVADQARKDAERAKNDAVKAAESEMQAAVLKVAERVLSRTLTKEDEENMAKEAAQELEKQFS